MRPFALGRSFGDTGRFPAVLLQAMKQEPPPGAKCRDKFLVQSVAVTADKEFTSTESIVRVGLLPKSFSCLLTFNSGNTLLMLRNPPFKKRRFE